MTELDKLVDAFTKTNSQSAVFQAVARNACGPLQCSPEESYIVLNALTAIVVEQMNQRRINENLTVALTNAAGLVMLGDRIQKLMQDPVESMDKLVRETRYSGSAFAKQSLSFLQSIQLGMKA